MDIRKWLVSSSSKPKDSSSNVGTKKERPKGVADSPSSSSGNKKQSKKRPIIESDSDEEPIPQKEKSSNKNKSPKARNLNGKLSSSKSPKGAVKEVSALDFFGSESVSKTSKKANSHKQEKNDISLHDDDDFEATLKQLDNAKPIKNETQKTQKPDPILTKNENKKGSSLPTKRKAKSAASPKMEITPNPKPPPKAKIIIDAKDDKPAAKKPRNSGNANYASYLHREGPKALGSKEIPEGAEGCLAGLTFIVTGVLESIERDEAKVLIEKYGGKVMSTITKNTKYIVIGRDAGASKLEKAEKLGTIQLDEDGLLNLINTRPGKDGSLKPKTTKNKEKKSSASSPEKSVMPKDSLETSFFEDDDDMDLFDESPIVEIKAVDKNAKEENSESKLTKPKQKNVVPEKMDFDADNQKSIVKTESPLSLSMWVDKYKPSSIKQIIGQQGDKSNAKKLLNWVVNWRKNRRLNKKAIPGRYNAYDDGSGFKAALLSGSPGVGKTTTAQLVCKEAGCDFFELNASDTRSKKTLQQMVSQLLGNQTLADCFKDDAGKVTSNHVIIMDEVDGMGGNEDRGGMMELISFIKASKVPIICICNDRNHLKIRSLSNHCFDLRFQRPRVEQIKAAMMSIAFKEHIKVSPEALQDVIVASNQDVRQVLHNMSMWSAKSKGLTSDQTKADIGRGTKHIKKGPFDVLREVFEIGKNPKATIIDKSDLFFHDYSLSPLFVQENYVHVIPTEAQGDKKKHLRLLSATADSICIGDMIDCQIRSQNSWSLLPTQAVFASVVPGELLKGHLKQMINFPVWLGKYSTHRHMDRVLQELHVHMRMRITGNKTDVALEYLPLLKRALTKPLIEKEQEGIPDALRIMEDYFLLREDFDSIIDLSLWPNQTDPRTKIVTKVKSAFTRAYNKECGKNPYATTNVKKKKGASKSGEDGLDEDNDAVSEEEGDDDIEKDAMIKVKKPPKKTASESNEPSTSKDKKKNPSKRGRAK